MVGAIRGWCVAVGARAVRALTAGVWWLASGAAKGRCAAGE